MSEPDGHAAGGQATASQPSATSDTPATREQIEAAIEQRRRQRTRRNRRMYLLIRVVSLVIVLAAWQYYGSRATPIVFDPLTRVLGALVDLFRHNGLASALWYSVWTFAIGYLTGLVAGVVLGMFIGAYRRVESAVGLYVYALYATPMVAIVPLLSIWLGFGVFTQELIIALFVLFPCVVSVSYGVRNIDGDLLEVARSMRMNRASLWRHVLLRARCPTSRPARPRAWPWVWSACSSPRSSPSSRDSATFSKPRRRPTTPMRLSPSSW